MLSFFHGSADPLFHLKQVQYVTILENLKSPEGWGVGGRRDGRGGEVEVDWKKKGQDCRRKKEGERERCLPLEPLLCEEIFHKLCEIIIIIFFAFVISSSSCTLRTCLICLLSIRCLLHRHLGLHPLAKRRIYWLS